MNTTERKLCLENVRESVSGSDVSMVDVAVAIKNLVYVLENWEDTDSKEVDGKTMEEKVFAEVTEMLKGIGVPTSISGHEYARTCIIWRCFDQSRIHGIIKKLYQEVAEKYRTSWTCVERNIRYAVEIAWDRGNPEVLDGYFGYTVSGQKGKPTNSEFIATIADEVRRKLKM